MKDIEGIKKLIKDELGNKKNQDSLQYDYDLNELSVVIPKEIDKVEDQIAKLKAELNSM